MSKYPEQRLKEEWVRAEITDEAVEWTKSFGFFLQQIFEKRKAFLKILVSVLLIVFTYYSINFENHSGRCFGGELWDWAYFKNKIDIVPFSPF